LDKNMLAVKEEVAVGHSGLVKVGSGEESMITVLGCELSVLLGLGLDICHRNLMNKNLN
jgi:hypothetical protein